MIILKSLLRHLLTTLLIAITLGPGTASGANPLEPGKPPEWLKPWLPPQVPVDYQSPGNLHKVIVDSRDSAQLAIINKLDALAVFPYQQRRVYLISSETLNRLRPATMPQLKLRDDQNLIRLRDRFFDTTVPLPEVSETLRLKPLPDAQLHLVQFSASVKDDWVAGLRQIQGLRVVSYVPENAYLVWASQSAREALSEQSQIQPQVQWQGAFHPAYKLHPAFNHNFEGNVFATVQLFTHEKVDESIGVIREKASNVLKEPRQVGVYTNMVIEVPASELDDLSLLQDVVNVEPFIEPGLSGERQGQILTGGRNAAGTGPNGPGYLAWLNGLGFTSNFDFVVDVTDDGFDQGETTAANVHPVFLDAGGTSRVAYARRVSGTTVSTTNDENSGGHGTVDATIVAGFNNAANTDADFDYHADADGYRFGLGIAPYAQLGATKILGPWTNPDFTTVIDAAYADGARISNNSWGTQCSDPATGMKVCCPAGTLGDYDAASQEYDGLVRDARPMGAGAAPSGGEDGNQEITIVFAAGNEGNCADEQLGNNGATAKNTITVGASENFNATGDADGCGEGNASANDLGEVIHFSSRGPTQDGRTKPDIMAPGTHIYGAASQDSSFNGSSVCGSATNDGALPPDDAYYPADPDTTDTQDQDLYTWSSGTSHSAPAVAGGAALLRQWFLNNGRTPPSPAMTKAYLMNSASYMTGPADDLPSDNQGMGQMNLGMAFDNTPRLLFDQIKTAHKTADVDASETFVVSGQVSDNTRAFRVTMAYTDAPAISVVGPIRTNDLDLEVQVGGNFYRGNDFNQDTSNVGAVADLPDEDNNVESVFLPAGTTGNFTVTVRPTDLNSDGVPNNGDADDQDFALVIYNAEFPARDPVDIILTLDVSGSMDDPAPGETNLKLDLLKDAVEMFIRTWEPFAIPEDRLGVVYFSSAIAATHPTGSPLLLPFSANANDFIDNVRGQTAGGCTALGGGVLTALRGFDALPDRQRHIIVFSNGMQNRSPMVTDVSPTAHQILADPSTSCGDSGISDEPGVNLADYDVKAIHTIGTGTPAAWQALIAAIASETGGEHHFTSTPDEDLEDFFLEDLVAALRVDPVEKVATRKGTLTNEGVGESEDFEINQSVRKATFAVSWQGDRRPGAVNFSLVAPNGTPVPPHLIKVQRGPFYRIATLEFPLSGAGTTPTVAAVAPTPDPIPHSGTWKLVFHPKLVTHEVTYRAHLIVDDADIRYQFTAPTAGIGIGEAMPLSLWVQHGNRTLTNLDNVQVTMRRPPTGFGTFLATTPLSADQMAKKIDLSGDQFNNLAGKKAYLLYQDPELRTSLQPIEETIELLDSGMPEQGDAKSGDGVYSALYTNTQRPGLYQVELSFRVVAEDGTSVLRTDKRTLNVGMKRFDLTKSTIDIRQVADPEGGLAYKAKVTLIDAYDNYLGPGHRIVAIVAVPGDKWGGRQVRLEDNLDGSYSGRIVLRPEEIDAGAGVRIAAAGRVVTEVALPEPETTFPQRWWLLLLIVLIILILIVIWIRRAR